VLKLSLFCLIWSFGRYFLSWIIECVPATHLRLLECILSVRGWLAHRHLCRANPTESTSDHSFRTSLLLHVAHVSSHLARTQLRPDRDGAHRSRWCSILRDQGSSTPSWALFLFRLSTPAGHTFLAVELLSPRLCSPLETSCHASPAGRCLVLTTRLCRSCWGFPLHEAGSWHNGCIVHEQSTRLATLRTCCYRECPQCRRKLSVQAHSSSVSMHASSTGSW